LALSSGEGIACNADLETFTTALGIPTLLKEKEGVTNKSSKAAGANFVIVIKDFLLEDEKEEV